MTERASEPQWIAVLTHANSETRAEHHLRRQGFAVYLPRYLKLVRHAHRSDYLPRPLFPRYLFVDLSARASWRSILSTVGVSNIVCAGDRLTTVPVSVIDEIRAREDQEGYVRLNRGRTFNRGEAIRVDLGSCDELDGIFESCDEHERVTILVNILGRQVRTRLPLEAIRATA
ncbi:MAG: transcriptional activator RfaH [Rhodospirillales bacterium]|jgi:transcriptional antiterminator RfaH|nr:transcriptional activator RfaH [Rhodospirillales bacterium]